MSSIYEKWDSLIDTEGLIKDIEEADENGGVFQYEEVVPGEYEVSVKKMELKASSAGNPMVSIWFKIVDGKYENQIIFFNQVVTRGFQVHIVNDILKALISESPLQPEVKFENYTEYSELILDIHELIDGNYEYLLDYGKTKKGYNTFKIKEVFELE